jgi:hypothetical protein
MLVAVELEYLSRVPEAQRRSQEHGAVAGAAVKRRASKSQEMPRKAWGGGSLPGRAEQEPTMDGGTRRVIAARLAAPGTS